MPIVKSMELILLSSSVDSVALLLNGSAGALLISVNLAIKGKSTATTYLRKQRLSCLNVDLQRDALSKSSILRMVRSSHLGVLCAEMKWLTRKTSDQLDKSLDIFPISI